MVPVGARSAACARLSGPRERVSEAKAARWTPAGRRRSVRDLVGQAWRSAGRRAPAPRGCQAGCGPAGPRSSVRLSHAEKLAGTRMAGFVFTRQAPAGKWGAATYALKRTAGEEGHRDHRGHRVEEHPTEFADAPYGPDADGRRTREAADSPGAPMPPMPPMASPASTKSAPGQNGAPGWRGRL